MEGGTAGITAIIELDLVRNSLMIDVLRAAMRHILSRGVVSQYYDYVCLVMGEANPCLMNGESDDQSLSREGSCQSKLLLWWDGAFIKIQERAMDVGVNDSLSIAYNNLYGFRIS